MSTLSFTDKMFYRVVDGQKTLKEIVRVDASEEQPKLYLQDTIYLLKDFKAKKNRGRKDVLRGQDVLVFQTEKGLYYFPVPQLEDFANYLYSLSFVLKEKVVLQPPESEK